MSADLPRLEERGTMSDTKFTPGPWHDDPFYGEAQARVAYQYGLAIAQMKRSAASGRSQECRDEATANVYLAQTAPTMYAALEALCEAYPEHVEDAFYRPECNAAFHNALIALAAANGEV